VGERGKEREGGSKEMERDKYIEREREGEEQRERYIGRMKRERESRGGGGEIKTERVEGVGEERE
jgi:hypothetical protein